MEKIKTSLVKSLNKQSLPTQHLEDEIDMLVYKLYDPTYDEVLVVDSEFGMSEGEYTNLNIDQND